MEQKRKNFFETIHPRYWIYDFVKFSWIPLLHIFQTPKIRYYNKEGKMPKLEGRALIVCNHTWWMDPLTIIMTFWRRRIHTLAAKELGGPHKVIQWIKRRLLFVDVDRKKLDVRSYNACIQQLRNDNVLLVFPEGRFVFEEDIQPFKGGTALMALQTDTPIYPVYIMGYYRLFHPIHMAIGDPILVREEWKGDMSSEAINRLNEIMQERVQQLRDRISTEVPKEDWEVLMKFKQAKREALRKTAAEKERAWREAEEKGKI